MSKNATKKTRNKTGSSTMPGLQRTPKAAASPCLSFGVEMPTSRLPAPRETAALLPTLSSMTTVPVSTSVDFRVTNKGELPVSISRVRFKVISVEEIPTMVDLSSARTTTSTSATSEIDKPLKLLSLTNSPPVRQIVFSVTLTARRWSGTFRVWLLQPTSSHATEMSKEIPIQVGLPWNIQRVGAFMQGDADSEKWTA
jgi:hypothetical protein